MTSGFFDTNVLLYLLSGDQAKADAAETLLAQGGTVSVQVLNEFAHVARRKFHAGWAAVHDSLAAISANLAVHPLTVETHALGLRFSERYLVSVFDGQLLAAAVLARCDLFYSEDMQDGQIIEGLTISNPFVQR